MYMCSAKVICCWNACMHCLSFFMERYHRYLICWITAISKVIHFNFKVSLLFGEFVSHPDNSYKYSIIYDCSFMEVWIVLFPNYLVHLVVNKIGREYAASTQKRQSWKNADSVDMIWSTMFSSLIAVISRDQEVWILWYIHLWVITVQCFSQYKIQK